MVYGVHTVCQAGIITKAYFDAYTWCTVVYGVHTVCQAGIITKSYFNACTWCTMVYGVRTVCQAGIITKSYFNACTWCTVVYGVHTVCQAGIITIHTVIHGVCIYGLGQPYMYFKAHTFWRHQNTHVSRVGQTRTCMLCIWPRIW